MWQGWMAAVGIAIGMGALAAPAQGNTIQTFTIQNAHDPTQSGGVMTGSRQYWGTLTVDQDAYRNYQAANFGAVPFALDLFLGPGLFTDQTEPGHPRTVVVPETEFIGSGNLSFTHFVAGPFHEGLDQVVISISGIVEAQITPTSSYLFQTNLALVFLEPVRNGSVRFLGGVVDFASFETLVFDQDFEFVQGDLSQLSGQDSDFSAIAIDPQVVPASDAPVPEPANVTCALLAIGLGALLRRRRIPM